MRFVDSVNALEPRERAAAVDASWNTWRCSRGRSSRIQENAQVMERLREMEQRAESAIRENVGLKAEVDRLTAALREAAAGAGSKAMERSSSLQRIASAGTLAKSTLGDGTASPQIGGDDSPRGFVPFRSLQSYENLLSLQAGAQTR